MTHVHVHVCLNTHHVCIRIDADDVDRVSLMKVLTILQQGDTRDGMIYVTATGDVPTLRRCLERHPDEVGYKLAQDSAEHKILLL